MTEVSQLLQKTATIQISGPDALTLMQGQFTADLRKLASGEVAATYCAYCDVKGKIGWLFIASYQAAKYYLTMPAELAESFIKELSKYAAFAEVTITKITKLDIHNLWLDELSAIEDKLAMVYAATQFKYFPHDLRLEQIGAVSFSKGCFKGQEIIARMQHLGNIKRQTYIITHLEPVEIGQAIVSKQQEVGSVVRTNNLTSLAVITNSHLNEILAINGQAIKIVQT
jgi:folate-binding protein YgfZ